ncbi:DNA circularization N-terminal domain-containing protein [uncultured Desulfovibrio sp.]|uniref:DNA circularization protein n=1 Tax=uncultured Desulfovibrio sp. TaxID=167968 RepID=UPI00261B5084|nr:DNA circularization N-terminal domain-containing protein [uncultured Desulfovibrio sp.]
MASLWKTSIRQASFRGVPFGVTDAEAEGGRRTVLHEFPQRDMPYAEDMGMASARFTLQAFVLGADYMAARDRLREALQKPGPGTLVHPWLGELTVCQFAPYKLRETAQDGGMAVFTLSFVRSEAAKSPAASVNQLRRAGALSSLAGNNACAVFNRAFTLANQGAWVVRQSWALVRDAIQTVQAVMGGDMRAVAGLLGAATGYDFLVLADMGLAVWGALQSVGGMFTASGGDAAEGWCSAALAVSGSAGGEGYYRYAGQAGSAIRANGEAVRNLVTRLAVVEAVRAALEAAPVSQSAAADLRDNITDAVDAALGIDDAADMLLVDQETTLAEQLQDMRTAALARVAQLALAAPQVGRVENRITRPWLPVVWQASGGIDSEADLPARNAVQHPLFVPPGALEVLRG